MLPLIALAARASVPGDVQLAVFPATFEFAAGQAEALDPYLAEPDLYRDDVDCYDRLGVLGFNLDVPIDEVSLSVGEETLSVGVSLGLVQGEDMVVYGLDEDYVDTCAEFDADLLYVTLTGGRFDATLRAEPADDGTLALSWAEEPVFTGDLDMDIDWFPDDVVLWFLEDAVFAAASDAIAEAVPPLLGEVVAEPLLDGEYGDYDVTLALGEVALTGEALELGVDAEIAFVGTPACEVGDSAVPPGGGAPKLDLEGVRQDHAAIGLTEGFVNDLLFTGWTAGAFCERSESFEELVEDLQAFVDSDVASAEAWSSLAAPAVFSLDEDGGRMELSGLGITVTGTSSSGTLTLVDALLDARGTVDIGLGPSGTTLVASVTGLSIDFTRLELDGIEAGTEGWVAEVVEAWVAREVEAELAAVPLFDAAWRDHGLVVRVSDVVPETNGLAVTVRLYDEDDPEVDRVPPDTTATLVSARGDSVEIAWTGADDRGGALAYTAQVDGTGWIDWSEGGGAAFHDLEEGEHVVEVKARDSWLNEDPTPAMLAVFVEGDVPAGGKGGCGCAAAGVGDGWGCAALAFSWVARRRRLVPASPPNRSPPPGRTR